LAAAILSACSSQPAARPAYTASGTVAPVLVVARVKDAVSLDPAQSSDGMSLNITREIVKGLVQFRQGTFDIEPAIAQSWSVGSGGRKWTFVIKRALTFSDGTPVDAHAVKFNFDRWRLISNPYHAGFNYPYYISEFGGFPGLIEDVQVRNSRTVVFTLARPFAPFLHDLALPAFGIGSPTAIRNDLAGFASHPVGWGPYTLAEWVKGDRIVLRANPAYPVKSTYQKVVIRDIAEPGASVRAMMDGSVDVLTDPGPSGAASLADTPGVTVYYQPANNSAYLAMNLDRKPFGKLAVRKAVAYALSLHAIVKQFFPVGGEVADNWTPNGMLGENRDVKAYRKDDGRARSLLARAGLRKGFKTEIFYTTAPRPYMPDPQGVAKAVAAELRRIGIDAKLEPYEWSVFLEKVHNGEHPMVVAGWIGDNGDPDNFLYTLLDRDSARRPNALNYSFWRDERYHELMVQGQVTSDPGKRAAIYARANAMVHDMVPSIPIVHSAVPIAMRTSIAGYIPSPDTSIAFEYLYPSG